MGPGWSKQNDTGQQTKRNEEAALLTLQLLNPSRLVVCQFTGSGQDVVLRRPLSHVHRFSSCGRGFDQGTTPDQSSLYTLLSGTVDNIGILGPLPHPAHRRAPSGTTSGTCRVTSAATPIPAAIPEPAPEPAPAVMGDDTSLTSVESLAV